MAIGGRPNSPGTPDVPGATTGRSRSAAVYTPTTPGIAIAGAGSMETTVAWASWARTGTRYNAPSTRWLGMKVPSPLRNRGSSIRFTAAPRIEPAIERRSYRSDQHGAPEAHLGGTGAEVTAAMSIGVAFAGGAVRTTAGWCRARDKRLRPTMG